MNFKLSYPFTPIWYGGAYCTRESDLTLSKVGNQNYPHFNARPLHVKRACESIFALGAMYQLDNQIIENSLKIGVAAKAKHYPSDFWSYYTESLIKWSEGPIQFLYGFVGLMVARILSLSVSSTSVHRIG